MSGDDLALATAARNLQLNETTTRCMGDACHNDGCMTNNWPKSIEFIEDGGLVASYWCRRCGLTYTCTYSARAVFG